MKRHDLLRHLKKHGCVEFREEGNHTIYKNEQNRHKSPIPRHNEIGEITAREICKQLGIPDPRI